MYYLTLCSYQKQHIFGAIADGQMTTSALGRIVQKCWMAIPEHFKMVRLDEYVIMPNHFHGIILLNGQRANQAAPEARGHDMSCPYKEPGFREARAWLTASPQELQFGNPTVGSVATIIRSFKAAVTKEVRRVACDRDVVLWQRDYYEHIIRGESELNAARDYIRRNPVNWSRDKEKIK
jgi:putative transposase